MSPRTFGLVGYSTRALAAAVVASGFRGVAVDAFCDLDTRQLANCRAVDRWPEQILEVATAINCDAWLLAGGLENHGRIVEGLGKLAPVLGPTRQQLRRLRSLPALADLVADIAGLGLPETSRSPQRLAGRRHLFKAFRGAGGIGVQEVSGPSEPTVGQTSGGPRGYWQAWVPGRVLGITCIIEQPAASSATGIAPPTATLCGVTESLQAADWPAPQPFIYRGSLGPVDLTPTQHRAVIALANRVGQQLGYRGWLQADFIESPDGQLWLLEFNPRWTAGMELLQACLPRARQPLTAHLRSWGIANPHRDADLKSDRAVAPTGSLQPVGVSRLATAGYSVAKAIVYAPSSNRIEAGALQRLPQFQQQQVWRDDLWWDIADIPEAYPAGQPLEVSAGQPLLTLRCGSLSCQPHPREVWLAGLQQARSVIAESLSLD